MAGNIQVVGGVMVCNRLGMVAVCSSLDVARIWFVRRMVYGGCGVQPRLGLGLAKDRRTVLIFRHERNQLKDPAWGQLLFFTRVTPVLPRVVPR